MKTEAPETILIVEDEEVIRYVLESALEDSGYEVVAVGSAEEGLAVLERKNPAVAMLDIKLPGMSGIELLGEIKRRLPDTEVVIMTSHATVQTAVAAIRQGAYDFLLKPFEDLDEVGMTLQRAVEKRSLTLRNRALLAEQARQNRRLSTTVMRLSSLVDAGRALGHFHVLSELLDFFIALVADELNVDRASLMLLDQETGALRIVAHRGLDRPGVDDVRVIPGEGIAGTVAQTGEPYLVRESDRVDPECDEPSPADEALGSASIALSIPIKSRDKVLGVINVTNRKSGALFLQDDLDYLSGLAGQLAVAIERASHFEELRTTYESLMAAQEQLVFSERIKALGQMAAGVAHDFNNTLSVILARAQFVLGLLDREPVEIPKVREDLNTIKNISLQGAETIKRIQDYTRTRRDLPREAIDLNTVVREAIEMTRPKWKGQCETEGRSIELDLALGEVPSVSGNHHELTQVVGNLIFNAVEAMPRGGTLTFRTVHEDGRVRLEVSDTGIGMDQDTREHLFEPFFTTKDDGHGLGTSVIYGIVARHGGEIEVESTPGKGATFRIGLPAQMSSEATNAPASRIETADILRARVLLVEDDDLVRETYTDALTLHGHAVTAVESGDRAVVLFGTTGFDLVVTDLSMAGISGLDVAREVRKLDPSVAVILISGWAIRQEESKVKESGVDFVLAKPCLIENLLETVQQALRLRSKPSLTNEFESARVLAKR